MRRPAEREELPRLEAVIDRRQLGGWCVVGMAEERL